MLQQFSLHLGSMYLALASAQFDLAFELTLRNNLRIRYFLLKFFPVFIVFVFLGAYLVPDSDIISQHTALISFLFCLFCLMCGGVLYAGSRLQNLTSKRANIVL